MTEIVYVVVVDKPERINMKAFHRLEDAVHWVKSNYLYANLAYTDDGLMLFQEGDDTIAIEQVEVE